MVTRSKTILRFLLLCSIPPLLYTASCKQRPQSNLEGTDAKNDGVPYSADELLSDIDTFEELASKSNNSGTSIDLTNTYQMVQEAKKFARAQNFLASFDALEKAKVQLFLTSARGFNFMGTIQDWNARKMVTDAEQDMFSDISGKIQQIITTQDPNAPAVRYKLQAILALSMQFQLRNLQMSILDLDRLKEINALVDRSMEQLTLISKIRPEEFGSYSAKIATELAAIDQEYAKAMAEFAVETKFQAIASLQLKINVIKAKPSPVFDGVINRSGLDTAYTMLQNAQGNFQRAQYKEGDKNLIDATGQIFNAKVQQTFSEPQQLALLQLAFAISGMKTSCRNCAQDQVNGFAQSFTSLAGNTTETTFPEKYVVLQKSIATYIDSLKSAGSDPEFSAYAGPDALTSKLVSNVDMFRMAMPRVKLLYSENSRIYDSIGSGEWNASQKALHRFDASLARLKLRLLRNSDPNYIKFIHAHLHDVQLIATYTFDAFINHSPDTSRFVDVFERAVNRAGPGSTSFLVSQDYATMRELNERDTSRKTDMFTTNLMARDNIWLTYDNVQQLAFTALVGAELTALAIELLATPVTWGASAAATVPTSGALAWTLAAMRAVSFGSKIVLSITSAARVAERFNSDGIWALTSAQTLIDIGTIIALSPQLKYLGKLPAGATWSQWIGRGVVNQVALNQLAIRGSLAVLSAGYAGYQVIFAESLSAAANEAGANLTPMQIRLRALPALALSILAYSQNRAAIKSMKAQSPEIATQLTEQLRASSFITKMKNMVNPGRAGIDFYNRNPGLWNIVRVPTAGVITTFWAGYDILMVNEGLFVSYTTPDNMYMNHIPPFPDLKPGESAAGLIGFSPLDTALYTGAHSDFNNRRELAKYGSKYREGIYNFLSPEDLMAKLEAHAKAHGKIRYLKIMTHGRPGRLHTEASQDTEANTIKLPSGVEVEAGYGADTGWINTAWLKANKAALQARSQNIFAPDARIVLIACLAGANLSMTEKDPKYEVGEDFVNAMGDVWLKNGGHIDASIRALMGIEIGLGGSIFESVAKDIKSSPNNRVVPLFDITKSGLNAPGAIDPKSVNMKANVVNMRGFNIALSDEYSQEASAAASAAYVGTRAQHIIYNLPHYMTKFGIMLEGPWWNKPRFRSIDVPAH